MMLMASALTNLVIGGSSRGEYTSNRSDDCFKVLTWKHNVVKGKQFLPREKVASSGWQIARAVPKDAKKGIHLRMTSKWWEMDMKDNMINIKSQEDFDKQLLMARDKFTVVHFFSPRCGACKALHSKVRQFAEMHRGLQFLMVNYNEQTDICKRLNVCVLPLFRFYRGAEGRICSFSCTISTIHKFKDALKRHGVQSSDRESSSRKGTGRILTDISNASDASTNMERDDDLIEPSNE